MAPPDFRAVLVSVRATLQKLNDTPKGPITDTLWHGDCETLFDFIDAKLAAPQSSESMDADAQPAATVYTMEALVPGGGVKHHAQLHAPLPAGTKLYVAPQPNAALADGWMDIAKAPKDGTLILMTNGVDVTVGHWVHEEPYIRERRDSEGRYIDQDESDGYDGWIDWHGGIHEPTHFRLLPAPPTLNASKEHHE